MGISKYGRFPKPPGPSQTITSSWKTIQTGMWYLMICSSGQADIRTTAKTKLTPSHQVLSFGRSAGDAARTATMSNQITNGSGFFWRLPNQQPAAVASHQTGRWLGSSAKRIIVVVKNASPMSSSPRVAKVANSGHDSKIATPSGTSGGSSGSSTDINQATTIAV